jgi:exoribonuclease R
VWQACPWRYPEFDYQPTLLDVPQTNRLSLEGHTFHVDPKGCKDVDDVFTVESHSNGWMVTITISDVASYVEDGGAVDIMASLIGQTLYNESGQVLRPMLPADYSEKACSLLPGKKSYGVSLQFRWTGTEITEMKWFQSTFTVNQSFSYEEFQEEKTPYHDVIKDIASYLAGEDLNDAHDWIAQMMIFYNTQAGKCLKEAGMGILRRHSEPDRERLARYKEHVPELEKLAFSSAEYCLAEEADTAHYGLQSVTYAHASSPIRRYADLINQRILIRLIQDNTDYYIVPQAMYDMNVREKAIRRFARDSDYLTAIMTGKNTFTAIIMDKEVDSNQWVTIRLYVPEWKRMISTTYRYLSENRAISRDEKTEIDTTCYRHLTVQCVFSPNARNWKERAIIQLS